MKMLSAALWILFHMVASGAAYLTGYAATERFFESHLLRYPAHTSAVAVGAASALWMAALISFLRVVFKNHQCQSGGAS